MVAHTWEDLDRDEIARIRDLGAVVAIAVGAIEQHASHMPVGTDSLLSRTVTAGAAAIASSHVLVVPAVPYGFSPHHLAHAGTISLRLATFTAVLRDMTESLAETGFRRIVFVNGHGGNSAPLRAAVAEMVTDGLAVTGVDYWMPAQADWLAMLNGQVHRFGHACEFETSLVVASLSGRPDRADAILRKSAALPPRMMQPWVLPGGTEDPISAAGAAWPPLFQQDDPGYFGDPAAATAATGARMLDVLHTKLAAFFDAFARTPLRVGRGAAGREVSAPVAGAACAEGAANAG